MVSGEELDLEGLQFSEISPLATNERPLSCNCNSNFNSLPHAHANRLMQLAIVEPLASSTSSTAIRAAGASGIITVAAAGSFEDDFQLSNSAPAVLLSGVFQQRQSSDVSLQPLAKYGTNSPTASTLRLCMDMELHHSHHRKLELSQRRATRHSCGQLSLLLPPTSVIVPVLSDNSFRFGLTAAADGNSFISCFAPIAEHFTPTTVPSLAIFEPQLIYNIPTVLITATVSVTAATTVITQTLSRQPIVATAAARATIMTRTAPPKTMTTTTLPNNTIQTMCSNQSITNQLKPIDSLSIDAPKLPHTNTNTNTTKNPHTTTILTYTTTMNNNNKNNVTTTPPSCCTNTIVTDSNVSVSVSASVSSANSSTSSRRQRHSIAGQMSYMKMLGFGGFSKKMATSANSLFSTAVISGSSSAPNLRDMIPVSSSGKYTCTCIHTHQTTLNFTYIHVHICAHSNTNIESS